jgi:NIPSNAP protein
VIYEMRMFDLKPGKMGEFEKCYAEALPARTKISPLGGIWRTEIGPLNQVIAIWPYDDMAAREKARGEAARAHIWPPPVQELIAQEEVWLMNPAPFMRPLPTGELGNIYEMRLYTVQLGKMSEVIRLWSERIAEREKLSPLVGAWSTDMGPLSVWIHLWSYADMNERGRIRAESLKLGVWPPPTAPLLSKQENKILIPLESSPLR